jgi:hypothetical protein
VEHKPDAAHMKAPAISMERKVACCCSSVKLR